MELPNIGLNCSEISCKRLDFLPLTCTCGKKFCSQHFDKHSLECITPSNDNEKLEFKNTFSCSENNCLNTGLVPFFCETCNRNFCLEHRHVTNCQYENKKSNEIIKLENVTLQINKAKLKVEKEIDNRLSEAKKKSKNVKTAKKVELMLLKSKAKGLNSIPQEERVYFKIHCSIKTLSYPIFVSRKWSLGKAIDFISEKINLVNKNNKFNEAQLRLFKKESGVVVSDDVSSTLEKLITSETIYDGEELIIDYKIN